MLQILITNLFQNAIRHNIARGQINVSLKSSSLEISNTGNPLKSEPEMLFKRFKKDNQSAETIGLGLAIVKKICDVNGFDIQYKFQYQKHHIKVFFNRKG